MERTRVQFPGVTDKPRGLPLVHPMSLVRKRRDRPRELSASCARLREIRLALNLTQEDFASLLGIRNARLLSYEYGRTPNVPGKIMASAEAAFDRERATNERSRLEAERPMAEIIAEWARLLEVDPENQDEIAAILGVSKSTVYRWVMGEMKPRVRELQIYKYAVLKAAQLSARRREVATARIRKRR